LPAIDCTHAALSPKINAVQLDTSLGYEMTTLSVVIATKNRPSELEACLGSVLSQAHLPEEVVVVDQSSTPNASLVRLSGSGKKDRPSIVYLAMPELTGLTQARNTGTVAARSDIVLFLDDDVVLEPEYIVELLRVYEEQGETLGGAGGSDRSPAVLRSTRLSRMAQRVFRLGPFRSLLWEFRVSPPAEPRCCDHLSGCNMSFRRAIVKEFRFDEKLHGYALGEDIEFSRRVAARYKLFFVPGARLTHNESALLRAGAGDRNSDKVFHYYYFFRKNTPLTPGNCACFLWMNVGFLAAALAARNLGAVTGVLDGYWRILKVLRSGAITAELQRLPENGPRAKEL
jgi:GT2 family glycosyltransferase